MKYQKRLPIVDAWQWDGSEPPAWCPSNTWRQGDEYIEFTIWNSDSREVEYLSLQNGDWIVRLECGTFVRMSDRKFRRKYQPLTD